MRVEMLTAVAAMSREHLVIRRGRGRGSKTKNRNPKTEAEKEAERQQKKIKLEENILLAMVEEYNYLRKKSPAAEAEFQVTRARIIAKLKIKPPTFYRWLKLVESSFEKLKADAIRSIKD